MPRKRRYLIEFEQREGLDKLMSLIGPLDCTKMLEVPGMPGHPRWGLIVHGTAKQLHRIEDKLKMSIFDPYSFTCNRI